MSKVESMAIAIYILMCITDSRDTYWLVKARGAKRLAPTNPGNQEIPAAVGCSNTPFWNRVPELALGTVVTGS